MPTFTIQSGGSRGCLGLSLRGACVSPADAQQLEQAIQQFFTTHTSQLWVDCQQLQELSAAGQRALVQADTRARALGITCYWCGLPPHLRAQLWEANPQLPLRLLPASQFEGPRFLVSNGRPPQLPASPAALL